MPLPTAATLFKHRANCPANDRDVQAKLKAHREREAKRTPEDLHHAANRQTRKLIEPLRELGQEISTGPGVDLTLEILDQLTKDAESSVCPHLRYEPMQTWTCLIAEGMWRCGQCLAYFYELVRTRGTPLDPIEDHSCDLCRRYAPNTLSPLVLRVNYFVMRGGACARCMKKYGSQTQEVPTS